MVVSISLLERLESFSEVCHYMNSCPGATTDMRFNVFCVKNTV